MTHVTTERLSDQVTEPAEARARTSGTQHDNGRVLLTCRSGCGCWVAGCLAQFTCACRIRACGF
eukprot:4750627-Alexandrium_andersonii.AAC.1